MCRKWDRRGSSAPSGCRESLVIVGKKSSRGPVTSALETRRFVRFDRVRVSSRTGRGTGVISVSHRREYLSSPEGYRRKTGISRKKNRGRGKKYIAVRCWYTSAENNGSRLCTIDPRSVRNARIIERNADLSECAMRKKRRGEEREREKLKLRQSGRRRVNSLGFNENLFFLPPFHRSIHLVGGKRETWPLKMKTFGRRYDSI